MTEDMYLSLAIELFEKGTWSKDEFIKKIILYAKDKNIDMAHIDEIINRLTKPKEYTVEEKRKFLSLVTILGDELKYGDAVLDMSDEMIEKFYEMEKESLDKDKVEALHNMMSSNDKDNKTSFDKVESINEEVEENKEQEVPNEPKEEIVVIDNNTKFLGSKSINDIIYGNYIASDILGNTDEEKDARFKFLVENVKVEDLRDVANSLVNKLDPTYCLNFTIEWEKLHKEDLKNFNEEKKSNNIEEEKKENKVEETSNSIESSQKEENKESRIVIPKLSFDSYGEDDLPKTEEEYVAQEENMTKKEKDSSVRKVNISPERLAKLKKTKNKAINCFLKTAMVVLAFNLAGPIIGAGTVVSYMYFAEEIRCGTFNPTNPIGKAVKFAVEKVMNIGLNKDKENERGKAK